MAIARRLPDWGWLLLIGLLAQFFWFWRLPEPTHMDAYYYLTNGIRLAEGHGFTEEVIWQFLDEPAGLPTPSHSYWMPLPSMLAALGWLISPTYRAAQLPFYLLTATLPLLSFAIANWLWRDRQLAWLAGLLTAAGGFYASVWNQPETFAPFAWAGGLALWYLALARTGDQRRHWFGAGLLAALAHLSRADGLLFLGIGGLLLWPRRWDRQTLLAQVQSGLFLLVGYLLLMGPWLLRNWRALGRPLTTAGSQTLFLTNYDDLFAYGRQFSLAEYLAWGGGNILSSKLAGLSTALQTFIAICGLVFLTPLIIVAWRQLWRNAETRVRILPLTLYTVLLFVAMSLFFTFPGMRGGLFHSTTAIWPWLMALAPAGLRQSIQWIAARRPSWQPATAWRVFAPALVVLALALTVAAGGLRGQ
ncbi:MAG: hypothetical protein KDE09_21675, partial [Anaerolineales bacterium]|nr:hypothetical protein [Anaerolineales bacterium]